MSISLSFSSIVMVVEVPLHVSLWRIDLAFEVFNNRFASVLGNAAIVSLVVFRGTYMEFSAHMHYDFDSWNSR